MELFRTYVLELPRSVAANFAWLAPTLARIVVGWAFVQTGLGKLGNLEQVVDFFRELGIPYPELQAPFVASTEFACGALLVAGLATRVAALPLIGTMVVAIATAQWANVDSAATLFGFVETLYIVLFAWIAIEGPGPISIDALLERRSSNEEPFSASAARRAAV